MASSSLYVQVYVLDFGYSFVYMYDDIKSLAFQKNKKSLRYKPRYVKQKNILKNFTILIHFEESYQFIKKNLKK